MYRGLGDLGLELDLNSGELDILGYYLAMCVRGVDWVMVKTLT